MQLGDSELLFHLRFNMFGFYRIATCTTPVKVADVSANVQQIKEYCENAHKRHAAIALFPELALTSAACGDLFLSSALIEIAQQAVQYLVSALTQDIIAVYGSPFLVDGRL